MPVSRRRVPVQPFLVAPLEPRLMMCVDGDDDHGHAHIDTLPSNIGWYPVVTAGPTSGGVVTAGIVGSYSLSQVPALNSRPGAAARLFLDFNGAPAQSWGSYSVPATPAYDTDGNTSNFSTGEMNNIAQIWARVAEKYSPFNINVTTVDPGNAPGVERVIIGGNGSWLGQSAGGVSYVGTFNMSQTTSTSWVFPANLGNGAPKYVAEASSHEAGHAFNLQHQSTWSGTTKTNEYNPGDSARAPIMGNSYYSTRGLWWYGTSSVSSTSIQDDMLVLSSSRNGFGYAADDVGNTIASATPLAVSGNGWVGAGLVGKTSDSDVYSFTTTGGTVNFTAYTIANGATLDAQLSLLDSSGAVIASASTSSLSESLSASVGAGTYYISVASQGSYGDVGQYVVEGSSGSSSDLVAAPSELWATSVGGGAVDLSWADNASNESGYQVLRSLDNGASWTTVTTLGAGVNSYQDSVATTSGASALYKVNVVGLTGITVGSNVAAAIIPATVVPDKPLGLTVTGVAYNRVDLSWSDVSGESGFRIERSLDGNTWGAVGTTGQNVTTFSDTTVSSGVTYNYRVVATNAMGDSTPSDPVTATTPLLMVPNAPTNLAATATSRSKIALTWTDNANNETGFKIERSTNGTSWTQITTVGANVTNYTATGLSRNTTYYFRVRAYNSVGNSAYSNIATTATLARSTAVFAATPSINSLLLSGKISLDDLLDD